MSLLEKSSLFYNKSSFVRPGTESAISAGAYGGYQENVSNNVSVHDRSGLFVIGESGDTGNKEDHMNTSHEELIDEWRVSHAFSSVAMNKMAASFHNQS